MKRRFCLRETAMVLLCGHAIALPTVLNVPTVIQEQNQWCWAAVSASVIRAKGTSVEQCTIAEYARIRATWHDFGSTDCCVDPSQGCNYWNYNWGTNGSIQDILGHWGIGNSGYSAALPLSTVQTEIDAMRPFIIRWGWDSGGGHFVVGYGVEESTVYYMNPWPGEGAKIAEYSWVVSGGGHTWTHTNVLTTPLPVQLVSFRVNWANGNTVMLQWTTLSETNNLCFEVQRKDSSGGLYEQLPDGVVPGHGTTLVPQHYTYIDHNPVAEGASYRLKQIDLDGSEYYSDAVTAQRLTTARERMIPEHFALDQNYPNPFNPSTTIRYGLPHKTAVQLTVFTALGQQVAQLVNGEIEAGYHEMHFDGSELASGVYLYRMQAGGYVETRKLLVVR